MFCRCERLEEQLNDLTELHQNEILNLKQELASMEEKIAYQSYERARDIQASIQLNKHISAFLSQPFIWQFCLQHLGGAGGLSDTHLQDGAAAAAAAGGAAGGVRECHSEDSPRKINQRAASRHGRPFGVCVHGGQLRRPVDENPQPHTFHVTPCNPACVPVEALGCHFRVSASLSSAPQMTEYDREIKTMKGRWDWNVKRGPTQEVKS